MENTLKYAYLAGLFDGEGTITLTRQAPNQSRCPVISMSSTTLSLLEICKETFGGHIRRQKVYKDHHKPSWCWQIRGDTAIEASKLLLPFIHEPEKIRRMSLIISRYKQVTPRNGKYTDELRTLKTQFEAEFFHPSNSIA